MILGLKSCFKSLEFSLGGFVSFFCCACVTAVQKNLLGLVCWVTAEKNGRMHKSVIHELLMYMPCLQLYHS